MEKKIGGEEEVKGGEKKSEGEGIMKRTEEGRKQKERENEWK